MSDEVDDIVMDDMSDNYVKEKSKYLLSNGFDERTLRMFNSEAPEWPHLQGEGTL